MSHSFAPSRIVLALLASFAGCESSSAPSPAPGRLDVAESEVTLAVGDTLTLSVSALDESGATIEAPAVLWTSSDATVLSVDGSGVLLARAKGEAYAVATARGRGGSPLRDSTLVRVGSAFTIAPDSHVPAWWISGRTIPGPIRFKVLDRRGQPAKGVPVTFATSMVGATVSPTSALTDSLGTASTSYTLGPGTGIHSMRATLPGGEVSGHIIEAFDVIALRLGPDSVVLGGQGCTRELGAGLPTASGQRIPGGTVQFEVVDTTVAQFDVPTPRSGGYNDTNRTLRGRKAGETSVIASFMGLADTARVRVLPDRVQRIEFRDWTHEGTVRVRKGETRSAAAVALSACDAPMADQAISYTSLSPLVATIDARGAVTGHADGFARLVASVGGVADTATAHVRTFVILPADTTVQVGDTVRYRVMTPGPGGSLVVEAGSSYFGYRPSDNSTGTVVSVATDGLVTAVAVGEAVVSASTPPLHVGWRAPNATIRVVPRPSAERRERSR